MNGEPPPGRATPSPSPQGETGERAVLEVDGPEFARLAMELLRRGASIRFRARGGSMGPFIGDGDVLTVTPCEAEALRLGDVALYRNTAGSLFAHRVLGRRRDGAGLVLAMRGDASRGDRENVPADAVLGRVIGARCAEGERSVGGAAGRWLALLRICLTPLPAVRVTGALRRWLTGRP